MTLRKQAVDALALREQAAAARHGQSVYAPPGQRSPAQRRHDETGALDLIARCATAAGYAAGYEAGHRDGRRSVWRAVGPTRLVELIEEDLAAVRRGLDSAPDPFYPMGESW